MPFVKEIYKSPFHYYKTATWVDMKNSRKKCLSHNLLTFPASFSFILVLLEAFKTMEILEFSGILLGCQRSNQTHWSFCLLLSFYHF